MNTYQITATRHSTSGKELQKANEWIDAEVLEEARERFLAARPEPGWTITGEELIGTDIPEEATAEEQPNAPEGPGPAKARWKPLDATERLQELGRLVGSLKAELEEEKRRRAELEGALQQARMEREQAAELSDEQAIRAERAEDEIIRLKAKLYDCMTAAQQ